MKKLHWLTVGLVFLLSAILAAPGLEAQRRVGPGQGTPLYDPAREITLAGTVKEVSVEASPRGRPGTHLILQTEKGKVEVALGPVEFVADSGMNFAAGDKLEIIAAPVSEKLAGGSRDVYVAREVRKDGKVLLLRDTRGVPAWSQGGRRP